MTFLVNFLRKTINSNSKLFLGAKENLYRSFWRQQGFLASYFWRFFRISRIFQCDTYVILPHCFIIYNHFKYGFHNVSMCRMTAFWDLLIVYVHYESIFRKPKKSGIQKFEGSKFIRHGKIASIIVAGVTFSGFFVSFLQHNLTSKSFCLMNPTEGNE